PLADEMRGHRVAGVRAEAPPARGGDEEHVEALRVDLQVADWFAALLGDPGLDVTAREALLHLGTGERLVVPVARDVRIAVPRDEAVDVTRVRRPQRRQSSVYEKSHWTVAVSVAPRWLR